MSEPERRLEQLAEAHATRVLAYLARRTTSSDDAADVFQAVLIVAWRRIDDIPTDDETALAWLLGTARRCLANHRRGHVRRLNATERLAATIQPPATETADHRSESVTRALRSLKASDRELLTLVYWDDLTTEQAATAMDITPATARKRLQRARTRLRNKLNAGQIDTTHDDQEGDPAHAALRSLPGAPEEFAA